MYQFDFLPHTADVCLQVSADSVGELFQGALLGMNEVLREGFCRNASPSTLHQTVEIRSVDTTTLLIDFLSAVLTHTYLDRALYCKLSIQKLTQNHIRADIAGYPVDFFGDDIKAVTYHGAEICQVDGRWQTPIIFDI